MDKKGLQLALALGIAGLAVGFAIGFGISGGSGVSSSRVQSLQKQIAELKGEGLGKDLDECKRTLAEVMGPRAEVYQVASIDQLGDYVKLFEGLSEAEKDTAFKLMNELRTQDRRQLGIAHCLAFAQRLRCQDAEDLATKLIEMVKAGKDPAQIKDDLYRIDIDPGKGPFLGDKDAPVTVLEFSDFQCPYCKRAAGYGHQLVEKFPGKVKVYFKQMPLRMHPRAEAASRAALAAFKQGKFWEMHDLLFENSRNLSDQEIYGYASQIGLNVDKFKSDYESQEVKQMIDEDMELARKLNVRSTPTFFINGVMLRGARPIEEFEKQIQAELK